MFGLTAPAEFMGGAGIAHVFDRAAHLFQTLVKHLALNNSGPEISIGMLNEQRSFNIFYVGLRGFPLKDGTNCFVPRIAAEVLGQERPRIAFAEKGHEIVDAPRGDGGFEAVIVTNNPSREIAPVRTPGDHLTSAINIGCLRRKISGGEHIRRGPRAPVAEISALKIAARAAGTARITEDDGVTPRGKKLHFVPSRSFARTPHRRGAAMDLDQEGVFSLGIKKGWFDGPIINRETY